MDSEKQLSFEYTRCLSFLFYLEMSNVAESNALFNSFTPWSPSYFCVLVFWGIVCVLVIGSTPVTINLATTLVREDFPGGSDSKVSAYNVGDPSSSLGCVGSCVRHYWQNGGTAPTPSPHPAGTVPGWRN